MADRVTEMRAAFEEIKAQIEAHQMRDDPAMKSSLMEVYRAVDSSLAELGVLKDDIRELVERWKTRRVAAPVMAPQFTGKRPAVHEDHIGASTFLEKGWSKISLGDYEGAEQALQRAMELAPTNAEGQSLLGWAQMLQDKLDAALLNFQYVLAREPANALARINVGYICLKKGIFGEAIEHLSKALRQNEDARARLYANFYLGLVYTEREMYDDAQIFFERSIKLGPNLVEAYFELGHALWLSGDRVRAIATWKRGAAVNKFNPWSVKCAQVAETAESGNEPRRTWLSKGE
ncbi:MAG: tetratricopeptide repeat protein [Gemmatimonadaceae bacterium]